jgi:hypothetical protein
MYTDTIDKVERWPAESAAAKACETACELR